MTPQMLAALVLGSAALFAAWRLVRKRVRWSASLALAQVVLAGLLYAALFPPLVPRPAVPLSVLTPGATPEQVAALEPGVDAIALPGAPAAKHAERVPDLATALRRHPLAGSLRITGHGLAPRDLDAARGLPVRFDAAPAPDGIEAWSAPYAVSAGNVWRVSGRARGIEGGRVELVDPGAEVAAMTEVGDDGAFVLHPAARLDGEAIYRLRALRADGSVVEDVPLAVVVTPAEHLRVLLLAGGPGPELKYLRRWAVDAGIAMTARIGLSTGIAARDGAVALDPASLHEFDLVLVDERAWSALGSGDKAGIKDAVRGGLGLVLLARGAPTRATAQDWGELGFVTTSIESAPPVTLARTLGLDAQSRYAFQRIPLFVEPIGTAVVVADDNDAALGWMAPWGQGRVGLWSLADTYRLTLGGHGERFGTLWAHWFRAVARARAAPAPQLPASPRAGERSVVCDVAPDARVAGESPTALLSDPAQAPGSRACAAWWPARAGWHRLEQGDRSWPLYVLAFADAPALLANERITATRELERDAGTDATRSVALSRWPFAALWLALAALLWLLERRAAQPMPG